MQRRSFVSQCLSAFSLGAVVSGSGVNVRWLGWGIKEDDRYLLPSDSCVLYLSSPHEGLGKAAEIISFDTRGIWIAPCDLVNSENVAQQVLVAWDNNISGNLVYGDLNGKKVYGVADIDNFPETHSVRLFLCEQLPESKTIFKLIKLS